MLPLKLTLKGFYSYRQETTIDFAPLTSAGLFGIFGPVGAGKSALIEAMILALYKDSPKLLKKELTQMMNLASDELKVAFDFRVGEKDYRFCAEVKRQKKNPAQFDSFKHFRYVKDESGWKPAKCEAEEVIGLSQDNFLRAVVIPQGKFREFIDLGGKDRNVMMKELFNLERYDLAAKLKLIIDDNEAKIAELNGGLLAYAEVNDEGIAATRAALETAAAEQTAAKLSLENAVAEVNALSAVAELHARLQSASAEYDRFEKQRPEIEKKKYELDRYRKARETFKGPMEIAELRKKESDAAQTAWQAAAAELARQNQTLEQARAVLLKLLPDHDRREVDTRLATALRAAVQARKAEMKVQECLERIGNGENYVNERIAKCEFAEALRVAHRQRLKDLAAAMPDAQAVYEWENRYKEAAAAEKDHADAQKALQAAEDKRQAAEKAYLAAKSAPVEAARRVIGADFALPPAEALENLQANEREKLRTLEKMAGLSAFRELLQDREPCPMCGSVHHPRPLAETQEPEIAAAKKRIDELNQARAAVQKLELELHKAETELRSRTSERDEKKAAALIKWETLENIRQSLTRAPFSPEQIRQEIEKIHQIKKQIQETEAEADKNENELRKENKLLDNAKARLADLEVDKAKAKGEYMAYLDKIGEAEYAAWQSDAPETLTARADEIERRMKSVAEEYERAQKAHQEAELRRAGADATHASRQSAAAAAAAAHHDARQTLEILLQQAGETEAEIRRLLSEKRDVAQTEADIAAFEKAAGIAVEKYLSARSAVENAPPFDPAALDAARLRHGQAVLEAETAAKNVGALQQNLKSLNEKIVLKRRLEEAKKAAESFADRLRKLKALFHGEGFVQFVAAHYMHWLCHLANERFRSFTQNRYEIVYEEESAELYIRDYLHSGKTRSIKTLSGGQTFQAALCLALALMTMTAGKRREFFFLDEGFGTLDGDSLAVVVEALRGLRSENCTVGLISHVDRLREEIGAALFIENDPITGSFVKLSA